jgi:hypothetical protein
MPPEAVECIASFLYFFSHFLLSVFLSIDLLV